MPVQQRLQAKPRIRNAAPHIGRDESPGDAQDGRHGFDRPRCPQGVAEDALDRRERRRILEEVPDGPGFRPIVIDRPRAVEIDVVDLPDRHSRIAQGLLHRRPGAGALRMRGGGMMGVAGQPGADQFGQGAFRRLFRAHKKEKCRPLRHGQAPSLQVEWSRAGGIDQLKRMESIIGQTAQGIGAPGQDDPCLPAPDHLQRNLQGGCSRGTRGGYGDDRPLAFQMAGQVGRYRAESVIPVCIRSCLTALEEGFGGGNPSGRSPKNNGIGEQRGRRQGFARSQKGQGMRAGHSPIQRQRLANFTRRRGGDMGYGKDRQRFETGFFVAQGLPCLFQTDPRCIDDPCTTDKGTDAFHFPALRQCPSI